MDLSGTSLRIDEVDVTAQRTKTLAANHHSDFETFLKAYSLNKQKDERAFACTNAAIADMGRGQNDLVTRTEAQADHLKTTITMLKELKAKLDATDEDIKFVANHVKDGDKLVEEHAVELKSMHGILARLQGDLAAECGKDTTSIYKQVDLLALRVKANEEHIEVNKQSIVDVTETVLAEMPKVVILEGLQTPIDSRLTQLELQVGMDLAKHERQEKEAAEFNERAQATGWDMVTEKVKNFSIIARQRRDRERLEHTEHELGNLGGRLTKATSEFGAMRESCQEALNMVRTMHNKVAELSEQQDLTHEYWQGLSRGFRDRRTGTSRLRSTSCRSRRRQHFPLCRHFRRFRWPRGQLESPGTRIFQTGQTLERIGRGHPDRSQRDKHLWVWSSFQGNSRMSTGTSKRSLAEEILCDRRSFRG